MTSVAHSFESFLALAQESKWSRKQTRSELYKLNCPELWARRDELMIALGFAPTDQNGVEKHETAKAEEAVRLAAARARIAAEQVAREADEQTARVEAEAARLAALAAITDGAIIFCDACENTVVRVVNSYGRQVKFDNRGYRVALKCGPVEEVYYNSKCRDQFAAECYSVLKAVEFAKDRGLKSCTVRNDRIGSFEAMNEKNMRKGGKAATYLLVAARLASDHGLSVAFDECSSAENLADAVVRRPGKVRS